MDPVSAISNACAALGLSGAAGLNAWIPLLATGIGQRIGVLELDGPYDLLGSWPGLAVLAVLFVADFVGDKVPAVDHVLHVIGAVVHPVAGAVVAGGQLDGSTDVVQIGGLVVGGLVSGGLHAARAGLRPASTATTGGAGNPVLSLIEDVASVALALAAIIVPVVAVLLLIAIVVATAFGLRGAHRRTRAWRARRAVRGGPPPPQGRPVAPPGWDGAEPAPDDRALTPGPPSG